ncbi:glycine betaine ABC transporter substrate-binding protein [Bacillus shivajii]|uniref:glycine betaine ABC transporter substrate-binding protein n=1 Tax=Bacillus shivajii TaxID=1983719 RepID=UPI001CF981B6|nr:glycine betaine ABC transporter substrate-binding protein [Bacillus shivajii]UCZ53591.1 glycine betaine ABC transporter substrate-binding protein [Bacillus shivajii]
MKSIQSFRCVYIVCLLMIIGTVIGCTPPADEGGPGTGDGDVEQRGDIDIGLNNWAENIAVSNMWKLLLEEKGYNVSLTAIEKQPVWAGIARGDLDIAPEVWLPITDEPLFDEYEEDIEMHDIWYEGTVLGLAVPEYMDVDSIEELSERHEELDVDRIVGIDPGSSLMRLTNDVLEEYNLDLDLVESSEPAMMTELQNAYRREEPIVVTLWSPHWAFADYDLKYLEDGRNVYGDPDDIYYMTRLGFSEEHPEIVEWMDNWFMDDDSLGSLMSIINELDDPEEGARQWIEENRELVDQWVN